MAIYRKNMGRFFSAVDSRVIRSGMLTLPALGLLAYAFDHPDDWQFRIRAVSRELRVSEEETRRLFRELLEKGLAAECTDRYGVYYDIFAYPMRIPDEKPEPPVPEEAPKEEEPKSEGMSDERRAYWVNYFREHFPPTKDYKSPYDRS